MAELYKVGLDGVVEGKVESGAEEGKVEKVDDGYIVGVAMKEAFYRAKFEIETYFLLYNHYQNAMAEATNNFEQQLSSYKTLYNEDFSKWENAMKDSRSENPPIFQPPVFVPFEEPDYTSLWTETLTQDQIYELEHPKPSEPMDFPNTVIKEINGIKENMYRVETDMLSSESGQEATMLALTDIYEKLISIQDQLNSN